MITAFLTSQLGRWVTMGVVTVLLSGAGLWWWNNFKKDLIDEGKQECVQEINIATVTALEDALAEERSARARLAANLDAVAAANKEAVERRHQAEAKLRTFEAEMRTQREKDDAYREWADTPLPDGVADRLREAAGSTSGNSN
jgi:cytoskeletal protein RodZ